MLKLSVLANVLLAFPWLSLAQSACSGPQFNNANGFPAANSGCYPTNYNSAFDLGSTSPDDAQTRCRQRCAALGPQCGSYVAQVNKAADSNNYSGTCYFFTPGNTPTGPRACADKAYLLLAGVTDQTNQCFSSNLPSASAFCSSYQGIPVITITRTATPSTATATVSPTTISTISTTSTASATSTILTTTTTTAISTVATTTSTITSISVQTVTTTTSTTTTGALKKRANPAVATPACATTAPSSRLSAACSCLSVSTSTTTVTSTLPTSTTTSTNTITTSTTLTAQTTVTSAATTSTTVQTLITSDTASASTTTTISTTTTATASSTITLTQCQALAMHGVYTSVNGKRYTLQCGESYGGGVDSYGSSPSFQDCINTCSKLSSTIANFVHSSHYCFCLSNGSPFANDANEDAAILNT